MIVDIENTSIKQVEVRKDENFARFEAEPLERGFGHTLGNALRRVMLSSLTGAAITSMRIDGVRHEFSTIPGVKEDVTEIVLNLKEIALRMHTDEIKELEIIASGPCEVTAGDIRVDSDVEIVNPSQHIATLNKDANLHMTLTVDRGRGYVSADKHKQNRYEAIDKTKQNNLAIDVIPIDSIYTPILKVNYSVEDTRVGQITDYDKLILEVWTNGSLEPDEAIGMAAKILVDQLAIFTKMSEWAHENLELESNVSTPAASSDVPIEELELSARAFNCLKRAGINTVYELISNSYEEMKKIRNMGQKSIEELEERLQAKGLSLRHDIDQ